MKNLNNSNIYIMSVPLDYFVDKSDVIQLFSNPKIVQEKAKQYGLDVVFSPRKDKKYRIVNPETNKYVDFGSMYYEDYTAHMSNDRLMKFRSRNRKWKDAKKYSPAWLSYNLLW